MKKGKAGILFLLCIWMMFIVEDVFASSKQKQLEWFQNAKFGMFIHWGVYAMIGRHEQARNRLQIPLDEYQYYVDNFNPTDYEPDEWVDLAGEAGMKYIVITSKHCDGFCIFDSKLTDYDIMHSRYGKDVLHMLANSCKRNNMTLGLYYSVMDWHHPDYIPKKDGYYSTWRWEKDRPHTNTNLDRYIMQYMKEQLEEIIVNYDPAILWFDAAWEHSVEEFHAQEIESFLLTLKPDLLMNDRLFNMAPGHGDFTTPESYVPATRIKNPDGNPRLWEACIKIGKNSWGYNKYENEFLSTPELIRMLIDIVSKGGNLLLNVGPTPEGTIPVEFVDRLKSIGKWMKVNSEAIHGTSASCFEQLPFFGKCTVKGNILYFHIMGSPEDGVLKIPGLKTTVKNAYLLAHRDKFLTFKKEGNNLLITLPKRLPDEIATVVAVELHGKPVVEQYTIVPDSEGTITLPVYMAEIQSGYGQSAYLDHLYRHTLLLNWKKKRDIPVWRFETHSGDKYNIKLSYYYNAGGNKFKLVIDDSEFEFDIKRTSSHFVPEAVSYGEIYLPPGEHVLKLQITGTHGNDFMRLEKAILDRIE